MDKVIRMTGELEPRGGWRADRCTLARSLEVVSTRSAFLILREAFYGTSRFDEFAHRAEISEPVTAARLRELVDEGLLARETYRDPGQRTRQRYRLTEKGADLFPVLAGLMQWGDRWLEEGNGPVQLRHRECGARAEVQVRCTAGHQLSAGELELVRSPAAPPVTKPKAG
jgi:DNA-binding HxlR family transcriptional regulator